MPRRNSPSRPPQVPSRRPQEPSRRPQEHAAPPAKKSLGQHFLTDSAFADRIVEAAELTPADTVLEIGPGPGVLTRRLIARAGRVVAVEIDERFVQLLTEELGGAPSLSILHRDILEVDPGSIVAAEGDPVRYKVVANLPYYITSPILRHLLEAQDPPSSAVLMVQREVAERICARPGDMSILAVSVQFYATPSICFTLPPGAFRPPPNVESAVIHLAVREQPAVANMAAKDFFRVVRAGFGQKRKQLLNSLSAGLALDRARTGSLLAEAGVDPARRAETLSLDEWGELAKAVRDG